MLFRGGTGSFRMALLFCSAAVGLALLITPFAERQLRSAQLSDGVGLDQMSTGSVQRTGRYTIHRSVLQETPNSVCIIYRNGGKSGDCR